MLYLLIGFLVGWVAATAYYRAALKRARNDIQKLDGDLYDLKRRIVEKARQSSKTFIAGTTS